MNSYIKKEQSELAARIYAQIEFSATGDLKAIILHAENKSDQKTLEQAIDRMLKSRHIDWIKRFFKKG